jgi:hypothetical protein
LPQLFALPLATAMQRQHVRAGQYAGTQLAKPLDAFAERRMRGLRASRCGGTTRAGPTPWITQQPERQVSAIPAGQLLMVLKVAGATAIASGSWDTMWDTDRVRPGRRVLPSVVGCVIRAGRRSGFAASS